MRAEAERLSGELKFAVSVKMVREWRSKDYPLQDTEALIGCLNAQQRTPEDVAPDEVKRQTALEKLLKLRAERIAKDRDNAVKSGELIPLAEYMEINARIDAEISAAIDDIFVVEMPPKIFGMKTIAEISAKLKEAADRVRSKLYAPIRDPSPQAIRA